MGERKAESASARGLHGLKELPLASVVGGMAWGVARGVSSILEGYLEGWARRTVFTVTLYRSCVRSVTYVSKFCKPLDLKQSDYLPEGTFCPRARFASISKVGGLRSL
jgi:ABC-type thiamin/hydroxymethylpyrimidine transport system permease subunit